MNKKVITAGAASLVLAAMPIVGTFAEDGPEVTDTITLTVVKSCTLGIDAAEKAVTAGPITGSGMLDDIQGSTFKIVCNGDKGWELNAIGAGEESHTTDLWSGTHAIPTGETIDGSTSAWAFKLTGGTGIVEGYDNFKQIPSASTKIAESATPIAADSISVTYGISDDGDAPAGTYTGKVKYTLTEKTGD